MKKIERAYFGPAEVVEVWGESDEERLALRRLEEGESVDIDVLSGFSEAQIHTYIRLKQVIGRLKLPEIPADKLQPIEDILKLLLEDILGDGKVDQNDLIEIFELVNIARKYIFRRK